MVDRSRFIYSYRYRKLIDWNKGISVDPITSAAYRWYDRNLAVLCPASIRRCYWSGHDKWNFQDAALEGSSFYKLPPILQWFTGNIGFHHIHHLNARISNYNLQCCHEQISMFKRVKPMKFLPV